MAPSAFLTVKFRAFFVVSLTRLSRSGADSTCNQILLHYIQSMADRQSVSAGATSAAILLTGATGYIGGRLLRRLRSRRPPCPLSGETTARSGAHGPRRPRSSRATASTRRRSTARWPACTPPTTWCTRWRPDRTSRRRDRRAAENFGRAAARAGVRRIVYLGGLTDDTGSLSAHLKSRAETGEVLRASGVPVIEFRASIVIGAGSLSFEMIQALVERLPVMVCPRWVATLTQPIAIDDVLAYLKRRSIFRRRAAGCSRSAGPRWCRTAT